MHTGPFPWNPSAGTEADAEFARIRPASAVKRITSRDNPFYRQLVKLGKSARHRRAAGMALLDGAHLVEAYRRALGAPHTLVVSASGRRHEEIAALLAACAEGGRTELYLLDDALFRQASPVDTPTGIMALAPIPPSNAIRVHPGMESCRVLLEAIQDPGNLGSILRSAAATGAADIHLSAGCADAWSPRVLRAAMGAHFLLRIHEHADLIGVARQFEGRVVAATPAAATSLYRARLAGPVAFAFGNEGAGLSDGLLQAATEHIHIPMLGDTESLNAAAAAAVCLFERLRQTDPDPRPAAGT